MANKPREKAAEEPIEAAPLRMPPDVLAASEAFRTARDARRYRFLRAHPACCRVVAFESPERIDSWIDSQMLQRGWK